MLAGKSPGSLRPAEDSLMSEPRTSSPAMGPPDSQVRPGGALRLTAEDAALLDAMSADYRAGDPIYHPSGFWEKLNKLNTEWLGRAR